MTNPLERRFVYGRTFRYLHWLVALLFFACVILIFARLLTNSGALVKQLVTYHRSIGVTLLLIVTVRLSWRLFARDYPYTGISPLNQLLASTSHAVLYLMLTIIPLLGWIETSARGKVVHLLGFELPALVSRNMDLAEDLDEWHTDIALFFLCLVGLHLAAVAWHVIVKRDGVLYAMLPHPSLRPSWVRPAAGRASDVVDQPPASMERP